MKTTKTYTKLIQALADPTVRIVLMRGGTRSGKTWAILQALIFIAMRSTIARLISVVSESMPHLKKGCIRDFKNIMENDGIFDESKSWHDTDKIYTFKKGKGQIEFFSADTPGKVHGPARSWLYLNEGINLMYEVYRQLSVRTTEKIIIDWNPAFPSWIDHKLVGRKDVVIVDSTYLDNDQLSASQISEIESNRESDPEWFKVYGEGKTGSGQGLVIRKWGIVAEMPKNLKKEWIGVDFGWSNPTAIMHIGLGADGKVYIDELAYEKGMDNPAIAQRIKDAGLAHLEVVCDSAEPKSIAELVGNGIRRAVGAESKAVKPGLAIMNRYEKLYTARSLGSIGENRLYRYAKDPHTDEYTDEPIRKNDHAKDAERYVFLNRLSDATGGGFDVTTSKRR